jgi:hypothetical protein
MGYQHVVYFPDDSGTNDTLRGRSSVLDPI